MPKNDHKTVCVVRILIPGDSQLIHNRVNKCGIFNNTLTRVMSIIRIRYLYLCGPFDRTDVVCHTGLRWPDTMGYFLTQAFLVHFTSSTDFRATVVRYVIPMLPDVLDHHGMSCQPVIMYPNNKSNECKKNPRKIIIISAR